MPYETFRIDESGLPATDGSPARWWQRALAPGEPVPAEPPAWATFLDRALPATDHRPQFDRPLESDFGRLIEPVTRPLVEHAQRLLRRRLAERQRPAGLPAAALACRAALADRLGRALLRTVLAELDRRWPGVPAAERTGCQQLGMILAELATEPGWRRVLADQPVLGRILGTYCVQHVELLGELADRLTSDLPLIRAELLTGSPAEVRALRIGRGDAHRGGRSVCVVEFAAGDPVVYKPRSGRLQQHLQSLLEWYRGQLPDLAPRLPRSLSRAGYCWEEFIERRPCADAAGVQRFYRRQGALLALLYALGCTDVHYENLIAAGDEPVVVDVETVFSPTLAGDGDEPDPAVDTLLASVARVGLLPVMIDGEESRLDVSALGGGRPAVSPQTVAVPVGVGTDAMRIERRRVPLPAGANRPVLGGREADPGDFTAALIAGFRLGYEELRRGCATAGRLVADCRDDEIRVVLRDTYLYASLLDESLHPELLADAATHDAFLHRLGDLGDPRLRPLVDGEVRQLWNRDIPVLVATPGAGLVRMADPGLAGQLPATPALQQVSATLARLSPSDRRMQEWLVEAALASRTPELRHRGRAGGAAGAGSDTEPDRLLAQACGIADELCATARRGVERMNWLGIEPADGRHWTVAPLGAGLADGYLGVAVFLAAAYRLTGVARYAVAAAHSLTFLPKLLGGLTHDAEAAGDIGGGAMDGLGGMAWALAQLSQRLPDGRHLVAPAALEQAVELCARVVAAAAEDPDEALAGDVAGGLAGLAVTLPAVARSRVDPVVGRRAAELAGAVTALLRSRTVPGAGGGGLYGAASLAWASAGPAELTVPVQAVADPSWCSGLAGWLAVLDPPKPEVDRAVRLIGEYGPLAEHSLCHGELGVLEGLSVAARRGSGEAAWLLRRRLAGLLDSIAADGPRCATPAGVRTPGLLHGISGIGYGLLRLAAPVQVPSVLLFDPAPAWSADR